MSKVASGVVGIVCGALILFRLLSQMAAKGTEQIPPDFDIGSALFGTLFILAGIYYLVVGLKERRGR